MSVSFNISGDGVLLTPLEIDYLRDLVQAGDRPGFYMAYYALVGGWAEPLSANGSFHEMALQAQISSFSGRTGAIAWLSNSLLKHEMEDYHIDIERLSQLVAFEGFEEVLDALTRNDYPTISEILGSATDAWTSQEMESLFPGNIFLAIENGTFYSEVFSDSVGLVPIIVSAINGEAGVIEDLRAWLTNLDSLNGTPGTRSSVLASLYVILSGQTGKQSSQYAGENYTHIELFDQRAKIVVDNSTGQVVVAEGSGIAPYLTVHEGLLAVALPAIETSLVLLADSISVPLQVLRQAIESLLEDVFDPIPHNWESLPYDPSLAGPLLPQDNTHRGEPTARSDTLHSDTSVIAIVDVIDGGAGDDAIFGGGGQDELIGGDGNDILHGGHGDDTLDGGDGNDVLRGGEGNDILRPGAGNDIVIGGSQDGPFGRDVVEYLGAGGGVTMHFNQTPGQVLVSDDGTGGTDVVLQVEEFILTDFDDVVHITSGPAGERMILERDLDIHFGSGSNTLNLTSSAFESSDWEFGAGRFARGIDYNYSTVTPSGGQQASGTIQTIVIERGYGAEEANASRLIVDDKPLNGGASFDFDLYDLFGGRDNVSFAAPDLGSGTTTDRLREWVSDVGSQIAQFAGNAGGVFGLGFGAIYLAQLSSIVASWASDAIQRIIGPRGEVYYLSKTGENEDGDIFHLEIVLRSEGADGVPHRIEVSGWQQGDLGITIDRLPLGQGLDSGFNKDGQRHGPQDLTLAEIQAKLATLGRYDPSPADVQQSAASMDAEPGGADPEPLTRFGNDQSNALRGSAASDLIRGYGGDDLLLGNGGRDTFVFAAGDGTDTIEDPSIDGGTIRFIGEAGALAPVYTQVSGEPGVQDLLITYGNGDSILIKGWSGLTEEQQALWTFEVVTPETTGPSSKTPDLSATPAAAGGLALTTINGTNANDHLDGTEASDQISGLNGDDVVLAGAGNDRVNGGSGADSLDGGAGNDVLEGVNGRDVLTGGAGSDLLYGGLDQDIFVFNAGDGSDVIIDNEQTSVILGPPHAGNILRLGGGIKPEDLAMFRDDAGHIILTTGIEGDRIRLASDEMTVIGRIEFSNGVVWNKARLQEFLISQTATDGDDDILGFHNQADWIEGGRGDDTLNGDGGDDTYVWNRGDGHDEVHHFYSGTARVLFGEGIAASDLSFERDVSAHSSSNLIIRISGQGEGSVVIDGFFSTSRVDRIALSDGTWIGRSAIEALTLGEQADAAVIWGTGRDDILQARDDGAVLEGGDGNDVLISGAGDDILVGDGGSDTYVFGQTIGRDIIEEGRWADAAQNTVQFTSHGLDDVVFTSAGDTGNLRIALASGDGEVIIRNGVVGDRVSRVTFEDGAVITEDDYAELVARAALDVVSGTDLDDLLVGTAGGDRIQGGDGSDVILGAAGDDLLFGGGGDDDLQGDLGRDFLFGGRGSDTLNGGADDDRLSGDDGDDVLVGGAGNDVLLGGSGDDRLIGGSGNDELIGGAGNDIYVINPGDGQDTILASVDKRAGDTRSLELGVAIDAVQANLTGRDLLLTFTGNPQDSILIEDFVGKGWLSSVTAGGIQYSGSKLLDLAIGNSTKLIGSGNRPDLHYAGTGDDIIAGDGVDASLFIYAAGDGHDVIRDWAGAALIIFAEDDELFLTGGIRPGDVLFERSGADLLISFAELEGSLKIERQFSATDSSAGVDTLTFEDGTSLSRADIAAAIVSSQTTDGDDVVTGFEDTAALDGADRLAGGAGDDTLSGLSGSDVYVIEAGGGHDRIIDSAGIRDQIVMGPDIRPNDVTVTRVGTDVRLSISAEASVTLVGALSPGADGIEQIRFADGTVWTPDHIAQHLVDNQVTTGDDVVLGGDRPETLAGGTGNDLLQGGGGADTYRYELGDGIDRIADTGTSGQDRLVLGEGLTSVAVTASRENDDLILTVPSGRITLVGHFAGQAIEEIVFADGVVWGSEDVFRAILGSASDADDQLQGTSGDDVIVGGGGDDTIIATPGLDAYIFEAGHGHDTIVLAPGGHAASTMFIGASIDEAQITLQRGVGDRANDLVVTTDAAGSSIVVTDYFSAVMTGAPMLLTAGGLALSREQIRANIDEGAPLPDRVQAVLGLLETDEESAFTYSLPADAFAGEGLTSPVLTAETASGDPLPSWLTFDPASGRLEGVPDDGDVGPLQIAFTASDTNGNVALRHIWLMVNGVNDAPLPGASVPDVEVARNQTFAVALPLDLFHDADSAGLTLSATMQGGAALPSWLTFDAVGRTLSGRPTSQAVGEHDGTRDHVVIITATDAAGATAEQAITIRALGPWRGEVIDGTNGADDIEGTAGPDLITGGAGDDVLQGREGADRYVFETGWGHDRITASYMDGLYSEATRGDIVVFGEGILPEDIVVTRVNRDGGHSLHYDDKDPSLLADYHDHSVVLTHAVTGDSILIEDQFYGVSQSTSRVTEVRFSNGSIWTADDLLRFVSTPTASDDLLVGDQRNNQLAGGQGDDILRGEAGNDRLDGGTGNDDLHGGEGSDTYVFGLGSGSDRIVDQDSNIVRPTEIDVLEFGPGINFSDLQFTYDTRDPTPFSADPLAGSLVISIIGTSDKITIYDQTYVDDGRSKGIDLFRFANGLELTPTQLDLLLDRGGVWTGTNAAETYVGTAAPDIIEGRGGADTLNGREGDDVYKWKLGDGNDTITENGLSSFDVLELGEGIRPEDVVVSRQAGGDFVNDLFLTFQSGETIRLKMQLLHDLTSYTAPALPVIDEVRFSNGAIWTAADLISRFTRGTDGDDILTGTYQGRERLDGGLGNDVLMGSGHHDTYVFGRGYGTDRIIDTSLFLEWQIGPGDVVDFKSGIAKNDVIIGRELTGSGNVDLTFTLAGSTDTLVFATETSITDFTFNGFFGWSIEDVHTLYVNAHQTGEDDTFIRTDEQSVLTLGGNDIITGAINGAVLEGGDGSDSYVFVRSGRGRDTIVDESNGIDEVVLEYLTADQVQLFKAYNGRDLIIATPEGARISVQDFFAQAGTGIDSVRFSDGTVWTRSDLASQASDLSAEVVTNGTSGDDVLGGDGTFDGGEGADILEGGANENRYIFGRGSGDDTIREAFGAGADTILMSGLLRSEIDLLEDGADLIAVIRDTGERLTVTRQFSGQSTYGVEEIIFADGTILRAANFLDAPEDPSDDEPLSLTGTAGNDTLTGGLGDDTLSGLAGDDILLGGGGDDQLMGGAGADLIDGGDGEDTAIFAESSSEVSWIRRSDGLISATVIATGTTDVLQNIEGVYFEGDQTYLSIGSLVADFGTAGDDNLFGTTGNDVIYGNAGDDTIFADAGDDLVLGGAGTDQITLIGDLDDYDFRRLENGDIQVTDSLGRDGVDTLRDVEAVYFDGDQNWRSLLDLVGEHGTAGDDPWLSGTVRSDYIFGLGGDDVIAGQSGDDVIDGGTGYDQANYFGHISNFTITRRSDGAVIVADQTGDQGSDVLWNIEALYFDDADPYWTSLEVAVADYGTAGDDPWVQGTEGDDDVYGLSGDDSLVGRGGDDRLFGGDGFDQANYFGSSTDFSHTANPDGSVTLTDLTGVEGTDRLEGIEAVYFAGDQVWSTLEGLASSAQTSPSDFEEGTLNAKGGGEPLVLPHEPELSGEDGARTKLVDQGLIYCRPSQQAGNIEFKSEVFGPRILPSLPNGFDLSGGWAKFARDDDRYGPQVLPAEPDSHSSKDADAELRPEICLDYTGIPSPKTNPEDDAQVLPGINRWISGNTFGLWQRFADSTSIAHDIRQRDASLWTRLDKDELAWVLPDVDQDRFLGPKADELWRETDGFGPWILPALPNSSDSAPSWIKRSLIEGRDTPLVLPAEPDSHRPKEADAQLRPVISLDYTGQTSPILDPENDAQILPDIGRTSGFIFESWARFADTMLTAGDVRHHGLSPWMRFEHDGVPWILPDVDDDRFVLEPAQELGAHWDAVAKNEDPIICPDAFDDFVLKPQLDDGPWILPDESHINDGLLTDVRSSPSGEVALTLNHDGLILPFGDPFFGSDNAPDKGLGGWML